VSRIFSFSHTNELCGNRAGDAEPAVACIDPAARRRAFKGPRGRVPRQPWKGPIASYRVGKSKLAV
jgi:hypothetical protein